MINKIKHDFQLAKEEQDPEKKLKQLKSIKLEIMQLISDTKVTKEEINEAYNIIKLLSFSSN
jgi:hypothetical protein